MKKFVAFACAGCVAGGVLAGPNEAALRQDRGVSARVTQAEQGNPPPAARPPAATQPVNPQSNPALAATPRNIADLRADFAALGSLTGTNSATQKQLLMNDLATAAQGPKPTPASVSKRADDLAAATTGKVKTEAAHQTLAQNIHAIFNSSQLSPAQQRMIFDSTRKTLETGGVTAEAATNVVNDIQTIARETK